jgi:chemotaxis protein MotB
LTFAEEFWENAKSPSEEDRMERPIRGFRAFLIVVALLPGACVSKGKYETTVSQRDSLAAESAALKAANDSLSVLFREEIAANEMELEQLVDGVHLEIPADVMYPSGSASAEVGPGGRDEAVKLAQYLKGTTFHISVIGHTDNQQPTGALAQRYPTNWELAAARAANAVKFLASQGVDPRRMIAVSKGEFDSVATNDTPEGRAQNRRIEVVLRELPPGASTNP